jgi:hypothetical protein
MNNCSLARFRDSQILTHSISNQSMSSLGHYFVGGALLSSSTTWLQYFIGHKLSVTNTAISFASGDIPYWRWCMVLGMLNCVWTLSLLWPSSVEGIGGWTLQAPKFAILAGIISGVGSKVPYVSLLLTQPCSFHLTPVIALRRKWL